LGEATAFGRSGVGLFIPEVPNALVSGTSGLGWVQGSE
jgi:hypothetical protein